MTLCRSLRGVLLLGLLACRDPSPPQAEPGAAPAAPPSQSPSQSPTQPAATAPASPHAPPSGAAEAGGLSWQDAPPFVRRKPKSSMRAAEYGISGDDKSELTVFYFGPDQGGSIDANVTRWLGQFTQPDGSDSAGKAKRDKRSVGGIEVELLEVAGNFSGGMAMPGMPAPPPLPDAMLLGAIASGPQGPVFFKLVGPRAAVERARAGFEQMIGSLH